MIETIAIFYRKTVTKKNHKDNIYNPILGNSHNGLMWRYVNVIR